jgi:hypothetical protein
MTYQSLQAILGELFGECELIQDWYESGCWLDIRSNGYSFLIRQDLFFSFKDALDELKDIYSSIWLFERGGIPYA